MASGRLRAARAAAEVLSANMTSLSKAVANAAGVFSANTANRRALVARVGGVFSANMISKSDSVVSVAENQFVYTACKELNVAFVT